VADQPLLADGPELELVMCPQTAGCKRNERDEQQQGYCDCDGDGTDHGAIKIRSSAQLIKIRIT
jgi:hypothetical protein